MGISCLVKKLNGLSAQWTRSMNIYLYVDNLYIDSTKARIACIDCYLVNFNRYSHEVIEITRICTSRYFDRYEFPFLD